jgi:hypothetical protein
MSSRRSTSSPATSSPAGPLAPKRIEDRPSEDDLAQAELGGPKGSRRLPAAPLTKQEEEQTLPNDDPGHVA